MTALSPTLAAANRLMHNAYEQGLAGRQQREIDVQEAAGGYVLLAVRVGLLETVAEAVAEFKRCDAADAALAAVGQLHNRQAARTNEARDRLFAALSAAGAATTP